MTKSEIYRALAEGKTVQAKTRLCGEWKALSEPEIVGWLYADLCRGDFKDGDYRLAPEQPVAQPTIVPVAPDRCECGHEWQHHYFSTGCCAGVGKCPCNRNPPPETKIGLPPWCPDCQLFHDLGDHGKKPAPKMVPLSWRDVKPGDVVRMPSISDATWVVVTRVSPSEIHLGAGESGMTWEDLRVVGEISRDGCKTWQRCEKEEK